MAKKGLGLVLLIIVILSTGVIVSTNALIPNGWWYGDWLVEENVNATVSIKSPLGEFGNITSPTFVDYILAQSPSVSDVWNYVTRTLTNLNDSRAERIDNLDASISSRATQASVDVIDGIVDSILVDTNELQTDLVDGGRLDLLIDAIKAKTDMIVVGATQASVDVIDGIVDSILVDTNELQVDWVNGGRLDLLLDSVITDVAAIHTHVGTINGHITADYAATEKAAIDLLDDAAGGLVDIHTDIGTAITNIGNVHSTDLPALQADVGDASAATLLNIYGILGNPATTFTAQIAVIKAETALIVADTGELQTDWVNGGRLDLLIDAIKAKTDTIVVGATQASVDVIDGIVDTILVDTNELQTDWVNGGRLDTILDARASQTSVNTIDTVVDSILVDTSAMALQPGWTPLISTTTTDPVQNTYYTILNEATNGYIYTIAIKNLSPNAKVFTLKMTIDGTVLTSTDMTIGTLTTEYFSITGVSDIPSSSAIVTLFFGDAFGGLYIPYNTSLKVEARSTSVTWAAGFTVYVRRFIP